MSELKIDNESIIPKYLQIVYWVEDQVANDNLQVGDRLPSLNALSSSNLMAKETVVKAFKMLEERGIISSVQGKGFYVASQDFASRYRVFALMPTHSAYMATMYNAMKSAMGNKGTIDFYFHHYNVQLFKEIIKKADGHYTHYIISPFVHKGVKNAMISLPREKVFLLDRNPVSLKLEYPGVWQNFYDDIYNTLTRLKDRLINYKKLIFLFRDKVTPPPLELTWAFEAFCEEYNIDYAIHGEDVFLQTRKNYGYVVIDDEDLVEILLFARNNQLVPGRDIGVLSYNETPLKSVAGEGVSTISTRFDEMGERVIQMIAENRHESIENPFDFIDRGSM